MEASVVIVTGAAGFLGRTVASELGKIGYRLMLVDLHQPPWDGDSDAVSIGNVDLTNPEHALEVVNQTLEHFGSLTAVINLAGGFAWETQAESSLETWDSMYATNVQTAVNMCQAALPIMVQEQFGVIINVGAAAAHQAKIGMGAYAAAKSAVLRLTEAMAQEHMHDGIRVNAILPGIIDTPANRESMPEADFTRWVGPASIAGVIAFLLSEQSRDINGIGLPVTGRV